MQKMIPLVCLMLAGCGLTQSVEKIDIAKPSPVLTAPCAEPVALTGNTAASVETDWKKDRAALVSCGHRHDQQTEWYSKRDAELVK